jgi:hypothetical protein
VKRVLACMLLLALVPVLSAGCGDTSTASPQSTTAAPAATEVPFDEPTSTSPPATQAPPIELSPAAKPAGSFVSYENEELDLHIEYPEEWQIAERQTLQTILFVSPETEVEGAFRSNVSIGVQVLVSPQMSLQDYTDAFLSQAPAQLAGFRLLESEPAILAGNPGQRVVYAATQDGLALQWLQVWMLEGGRAYITTYTAEERTFDQFLAEAQYMIATLSVYPPTASPSP